VLFELLTDSFLPFDYNEVIRVEVPLPSSNIFHDVKGTQRYYPENLKGQVKVNQDSISHSTSEVFKSRRF